MSNPFDACIELQKELAVFFEKQTTKYIKRAKKSTLTDGILFNLLCTEVNATQESVTAAINWETNNNASRQAYVERTHQLPYTFYRKLNAIIDRHVNKYLKEGHILIVNVDGTKINLLNNIKASGIADKAHKKYLNALIMGLVDCTNCPIEFQLLKHKNERKGTLEIIKDNIDKFKGAILVMDAGFFGYDLFKELETLGVNFIVRLSNVSVLIDEQSRDYYNTTHKVRVVTYTIKKVNYYLATNLTDDKTYTVDILQQLYKGRWCIEEYFKFIKKNTCLSKMNDESYKSIVKKLHCITIISKLSAFIAKIGAGCKFKDADTKINNSLLIKGIYKEFLPKLICGKPFSKRFISKFIEIYTIKVVSNTKSSPLVCRRPNYIWSSKQFLSRLHYKTKKMASLKRQLKKANKVNSKTIGIVNKAIPTPNIIADNG